MEDEEGGTKGEKVSEPFNLTLLLPPPFSRCVATAAAAAALGEKKFRLFHSNIALLQTRKA